jgi:hypothetical protein
LERCGECLTHLAEPLQSYGKNDIWGLPPNGAGGTDRFLLVHPHQHLAVLAESLRLTVTDYDTAVMQ